MAEHYDVYRVKFDKNLDETLGEPRRIDDPGLNARMWGLPYFNGYTVTTKAHNDGECEEHRPTFRRRKLGKTVSSTLWVPGQEEDKDE